MLQVKGSDGQVWWQSPKYDHLGRIYQYSGGNGLSTTMVWDAKTGTVDSIETGVGFGTGIQDLSFQFDFLGNLTQRIDNNANTTGLREDFIYDELNRLVDRAYSTSVGSVGTWGNGYSYDAYGRLTGKKDVTGSSSGDYNYGTVHFHAVTSTDTWGRTYEYDAMGRLESRKVSSTEELHVDWTPFSKPDKIYNPDDEIEFTYGAGHQRLTRIDREKVGASFVNNTKKIYISGWLEQTENWSGSAWETSFTRLYISSPTGTIGVINHDADATASPAYSKEWMHFDHLGSVVAITDTSDNFVERFSYDPWGQRRDPNDWSRAPSSAPSIASTDRGFTGHEMLDSLGLVHMNGRIYDAQLGVFFSPDPNLQFPADLQSYNRYSYVLNNPLSFSDPSGYFLSGLKNFFKKFWRPILAIVVGIVTAGLAVYAAALLAGQTVTLGAAFSALFGVGGFSLTTYGAFVAGIAGGFAGGLIATGSLKGALLGALTGALAAGVGWVFGATGSVPHELARAAAHGVSGGIVSELGGGDFRSGFFAGSFASFIGHKGPFSNVKGTFAKLIKAAVIGGTAAKIGGGKFENGAVTAAFQFLLNENVQDKLADKSSTSDVSVASGEDLNATVDECCDLRGRIFRKAWKLLKEWKKYDPVADGQGGHVYYDQNGNKRITKPGGHYNEMLDLKRGIKNDITKYLKCIGGGSTCNEPIPRWIDELASRPVPLPVYNQQSPFTTFINGTGGDVISWGLYGTAAAGAVAFTYLSFGTGTSVYVGAAGATWRLAQ